MSRTPQSPPAPAASGSTTTKLRYQQSAALVLVFLLVCAVPLAYALGWWGLLLFVPIAFAWYLLRRVGADVTADEVVVRGPFYTRAVPRTDIVGLAIENERRLALLRGDGSTIVIPTARARDLTRLRSLLFDQGSAPGVDGRS